jgi:hypothetical protein
MIKSDHFHQFSAIYPHPKGLPYKHSLKVLASSILNENIQEGSCTYYINFSQPTIYYKACYIFFEGGHDSAQDASVALELALHYAQVHCCDLNSSFKSVSSCQLLSDVVWGNAHALDQPKLTIFSLAEEELAPNEQIDMQAHIYSSTPYSTRSTWERHAIGYWFCL